MSPKPFPENCIYKGLVYHARHKPFFHDYTYRVFGFFVDLDALDTIHSSLKFFSFNSWNITSLYNKDHGNRDGGDIKQWVIDSAQKMDVDLKNHRIFMLGFPRLWGYVFNPITIFFCYDQNGELSHTLYEVKNTFGEQHSYLLPAENGKTIIQQEKDKNFHVTPFMHMDSRYVFRFEAPDEKLNFAIHQFDKEGNLFTATWNGKKHPLRDRSIIKTVLTMPLMTLKVITSIHWQALRLWLKGMKYIPKPQTPSEDIS